MKVSIITASKNNSSTIERMLRSVAGQTYKDIELIVIDGASTDGTMDIVRQYESCVAYPKSEPDTGLYEALNKGIRMATGDVIGVLNADDVLASDDTVETIVRVLEQTRATIAYGDLLYGDRDTMSRVIRYWKSNNFDYRSIRFGWMPPHPTMYVRREVYDEVGLYNTQYRIASDYDWMLRVMQHSGYRMCYIPQVLVKMSSGGVSNRDLSSILCKSREDYRVLRSHHVGGLFTLFCKNIRKIVQFIRVC